MWLYNSRGGARSLGGQVTDQQGTYQAVGDLPADFADYRFIGRVTREPLDQDRGTPGSRPCEAAHQAAQSRGAGQPDRRARPVGAQATRG